MGQKLQEDLKDEYVVYIKDANLFTKLNIKMIKAYFGLDAYLVELNSNQYFNLKKYTQKIYLAKEYKIKSQIKDAKKFINVSKFYNFGYFGKGVTVAVIDTGIEPLLDFCIPVNRIIAFEDFTDNKQLNPYDDNGHGTFVSGVIGSSGLLSFGEYSGVAPLCNLVILKALNEKGEGYSPTILEAMNWIVKNKEKYSIKVACLSFGTEALPENDSLSLGAKRLWESGVVVVTAGGNDGPNFGTITSPGVCSQVITVGALDKLTNGFKVADYSSRGSLTSKFFKPDILAPGTEIISNSNKIGLQNYVKMSGTSVSTPIIAGVCALFCEKFPKFTPNQIKARLFRYAFDIGECKMTQGRGVFVYK